MIQPLDLPEFKNADDYSEWRLKIVLNSLPIPVSWARIEDMQIIFTNRKFTETYGYTLDDLTTIPEWIDMAYPNPRDRERTNELWMKELANPVPYPVEIDPLEIEIRCKNGTLKTALVTGIIMPQAEWALATFVDISDRKRDELLIKQLAEEDPLTGLANRRSFDAYLERSIADTQRNRGVMHLLILDLDHFKAANDTYGHGTGDQILSEAARRFRHCVRSSDIVARFGGDEFAVILGESGDDDNVIALCDRIIATINQPFHISGHVIHVGISIGISRFSRDGRCAHSLFRAADRALYQAKHAGRGRWQLAAPAAT